MRKHHHHSKIRNGNDFSKRLLLGWDYCVVNLDWIQI